MGKGSNSPKAAFGTKLEIVKLFFFTRPNGTQLEPRPKSETLFSREIMHKHMTLNEEFGSGRGT